jgi:hypothetical protein
VVRDFIVAVALTALAPEACAKKKPPAEVDVPTPPPLPLTSATTPPIWHPPDPVGGATAQPAATSTPPPSADLVKARAASEAKDFKKVRTLLEKKVRGGKSVPEESQLVFHACVALKDKACSDAVKAKHPEDITE